MRAFYYLFLYFLITCFQYTFTHVGKNLGGGGLAPPKPLMSAAYVYFKVVMHMQIGDDFDVAYRRGHICPRLRLPKVFGKPLRTMSPFDWCVFTVLFYWYI